MSIAEHTPVASESEPSALPAEELLASPPSAGDDSAAAAHLEALRAGADGVEDVEGYVGVQGDASELWTPPAIDLPDFGEASFGPRPGLAETVHGPDDRVQVGNPSAYPWRAICQLVITSADGQFAGTGTGTFIGPRTILTAGHCVFVRGSGVPGRDGWARSVQVIPGRNGASMPYGSMSSATLRSVTGWTQSGNAEFDYGVIILPRSFNVGWFGFGNYSDADLLATTGNIAGYPGDKPGGTQWFAARRIASVSARKVHYDIDTMPGQSGSGVYRFANNERHIVAVHAYGGATTNSGTRINGEVFNNLMSWKV